MKSIAYKWRLSTIKYAYITSSEYRKNGSEPNYTLAFISTNCSSAEEDKIKENVRLMSADEYRRCFDDMASKINEDVDGQYIKLKNWEYYYHFITNEGSDNKILYVSATASAKISEDDNVYANVTNNDGVLDFVFELPRGRDGKDGKDGSDGLPGEPVNDGKFVEAIYRLTKDNNYVDFYPDTWFYDITYQDNDFCPKDWTDRPSGINNEYKYEWVSTRKYTKNSETNEWGWGKFSTPALMSRWGEDGKDGDGIEYIYKRTVDDVNPGVPTIPEDWYDEKSVYQTNDEYVDFLAGEGWTDNPMGLEKDKYKFEWVSIRKQNKGKWQEFSTPALWSTWGKDGDDIKYIYFLNNDNEVPSFGVYEIDSNGYQSEDFLPTTNDVYWTDNYQSPTYEKRFSWISSRRKSNGRWGDFSEPVLFNTYKIGGKSFVDLYTRYDSALASNDLPEYYSPIYYSFQEDKYYSNSGGTEEITTIDSISKLIKWHTDIPVDNTAKMLFKTTALVEIKDNLDELIAVPSNSWYGPYLVAANGENAEKMAPYVTLDDDSLSLPIKEDDNTPHENYKYSFNANLYYGDNKLSITSFEVKASNESKIVINKKELSSDNEELKIEFTIDNTQQFTNIELIYIILYGEFEGKEIKASGQFKIIPFFSKDAVLYKILLNQDAIFVPSNPCENENGEGIWSTTLSAMVVDSKGEVISIPNDDYDRLVYESENGKLEYIPGSGLTLVGCTETTGNQIAIPKLPNPLKIIYQANGKTREIEYVNFVNMPLNGIDGISSRLVFAYCSLEEGVIPKTPSGGSVNFENNTIIYPDGIDENGNEVTWGDSSNLSGVVWLSQCEYFNDGTEDLVWTAPFRINGPKGDNPYHVELTNDMDQIYVTDGVIIYPQTVSTTISLFNGDEKTLLESSYISTSINNEIFENPIINNVNENDNKDVIIELTTKTGVAITGKTIDVNLTITGDSYGKSYNFIKTFKLKVLNGTKDYDLDVSPTFIKKNKNKQYSESAITVNITERDIATDSKTVTTLTSFTEGLSIKYFYNNDSGNQKKLEILGDKIAVANVEGYNDEINKVTINLYKDSEPIDQVFVECISDGFDGSSYHLELTNEYEQLYVTDNKVVFEQTVETNYSLFNGIVDANDDISTITVTIDGGRECKIENYNTGITAATIHDSISITPIDKKVSIVFNTGQIFYERDIKAKFSIETKNGVTIEKILKIIVLNGTKDYDLVVQPTYLKLDKYGKLANSSITVSVSERDISTTNNTIKFLEKLPSDDIKVKYDIKNYGEQLSSTDLVYTGETNVINVTNNIEYAIIELLSGETKLDYIKIETLKDGADGVDGLSQIIDLSNDYDQLYVTDGVVVENQTIDTTVYLTNGLEKFDINTGDTKIYLEDVDITNNISREKADKGVKLSFNFDSGYAPGKNELVYTIKVEYGENTFEKTFKIIVLNGTKDYDLDINPTIVRKDKHGNYIPSSLTLNVIESNISTTDRNSTKIGTLPSNYTLQYFVDDVSTGTKYELNGINSEINFEELKPNSYIRFELSGDTLVDYVNIECVSDGVDGSAYHLELSNEFDQVYTINNKILPGQTGITTTVQLFNGTQEVSISGLAVSNYDDISTTGISGDVVSISFKEGEETNKKEYVYKISGKTTEGYDVEKDFKIIVLNGNKDYDLHSTHTYVKKYGDNIIDSAITITVSESIIGTNDRSVTTLNSLPEGMEIKVFVDGSNLDGIKYISGVTINPNDINLQQIIEVELYNADTRVDYIAIEVVKDGKDGVSPYHIELSNDFDQILTTNNKVVHNQTIETTLSLHSGEDIINIVTDNIRCEYDDSLFVVSPDTTNNNKYLTYTISAITGMTLEQNKTYDFGFIVSTGATNLNYEISKKFKVIALNGTVDYDLSVTPTILKNTTTGYSSSAVTITVKETDISRTDRQINTLTGLPESLDISYTIGEKTTTVTDNYSTSGATITSEVFPGNGNIIIQLFKDKTKIDEAIVEIISDGKDGDPGVDGTNIEFIYKLYKDEDEYKNDITNFEPYSASTKNDIITSTTLTGWTDSPCGITKDYQIEACSQHIKEAGATGFTSWCTPFIWAKWGDDGIDGDGVEYIFTISNDKEVSKPINPGSEIDEIIDNPELDVNVRNALREIVNTFDFYPGDKWITTNEELINSIAEKYTNLDEEFNSNVFKRIVGSLDFNWTDDPKDVGPYEKVEWVSIRKKKVMPDGSFKYEYTNPTIWAEWKRDSYNSITEFIFAVDNRDLSTCTVTGGTWEDLSSDGALKNKDGEINSDILKTYSGETVLTSVTWYDSVPNHNMFAQSVWMVKGFASGEITYTGGTIDANENQIPTGITYSEINWTSPTKLIDSQFMQVEYSCIEGNGEIPNPINLSNIISERNLTLQEIENEFRDADSASGRTNWYWKNSNELNGETPVWMIISTFYNGEWSDWVVNRVKGEQGEKGETGQNTVIKGKFSTLEKLENAYNYYRFDIIPPTPVKPIDYIGYPIGSPDEYFYQSALTIGDAYIVDKATIKKDPLKSEEVFGYLYVFVKDDENFEAAWEPVGQVKGESSYIYIAYASSVTINDNGSKTYYLTEGGTQNINNGNTIIFNSKYYGTTPGKYIGYHIAAQQYEGHPYPPKLYSSSAITDTDTTFLWNKWQGDDGFGQEQIFILSGETAPKVPVYDGDINDVTGITKWNGSDFVPNGWSDNPLTPTIDNRYCWMATRQFPFNGEGPNNFKGVSGETGSTATLFTYLPVDGTSAFHLELSNEMEQVYSINNEIITPQTASTIITLFEGANGIRLNESNVVLPSGVTVTGNSDGSLTIYKVYSGGTLFERDEDKIEIRISANTVSNLDYDIVRTFKVIKLNGTKDYDLDVTPTYIKKDKKGNLSHTSITISVTESEISSTNREIKPTKGIPEGYYVVAYMDGMDGLDNKSIRYESPNTSTSITVDDSYNFYRVELSKDKKIIDTVTVEILKDGIDGISTSSPFHVELSNEFDLISTINGKVNGNQTYTTNVELYEGDEPRVINSITVSNNSMGAWESGKTNDDKWYVSANFSGVTGFTTAINPIIKVNDKYDSYVTIKPMEGVALYQLESDTGFVTKGETKEINITVKQKTNNGLIDVDSLPSGMGIYVYHDNTTTPITSTTATALTYTYNGEDISEIDIRLIWGKDIYDNINVEVKNDIRAFGTLNINPLEKIVYVDDKNKPMVNSLTFDASFIYEGQQVDLTSTALTITVTGNSSNTNDFKTGVTKTASTLKIDYISNGTIENLTKEKYIFISEYRGDTYENEFYVTYIKRNFEIMSDGDTIYVPKKTDMTISRKLGLNVVYNGSNITKDCDLSSSGETSGVTFNQRAGIWYANIPKEICKDTGITDLDVVIESSGLTEIKKYTLIRGEETNDYWFINVSPKYLSTSSAPIEIYLTKNSYEGNYISLENAKDQNMKLYYIIDGECVNVAENGNEIEVGEICYSDNLKDAPKIHGNNAFYPDGYLLTGNSETGVIELYRQEPIYSSIEFKLYYEPDNNSPKELVASEKVERFDILRNTQTFRVIPSGLEIDVKGIFNEYDSENYDIVIKEIK